MRKLRVVVTMTVATWLLTATSAFAAGRGEEIGQNLGGLLGGWAKSLYAGIAAVVALVFLLNRRFADLAIFLVAAVLVGGFVIAPHQVAGTVHDIWSTLTGG